MTKEINIENRVAQIAKELSNGIDRKVIVSKYAPKWKVSGRTFDRYIKEAKKIAKKTFDLKIKAESDALYDSTKKCEEWRLLNRDEKRGILAKIARGEYTILKMVMTDQGPKQVRVKPNHLEIIRAIELDSKMEGDFAPVKTKVDNTYYFLDFLMETSADEPLN